MADRSARRILSVAWVVVLAVALGAGLQDVYGQHRSAVLFAAATVVTAGLAVAAAVPLIYLRSFVLAGAITYVGTGGFLSPGGTALVGICAFAFLALARADEARRQAGRNHELGRFAPSPGPLAALLAAALLLAPVIAMLPRIPAIAGTPTEGEIGSGAYWGFGNDLDLATRGELSDEEVMRVRTSEADLWRGQTFDYYDGRSWTRAAGTGRSGGYVGDLDSGNGQYAVVNATAADSEALEPHVQVFEYSRGVSDIVFGANRLWWVEVPAQVSYVDADGSIRLRYPLGAGSSYTAFSLRPDPSAEELRTELPDRGDGIYSEHSPYLQLPRDLSPRIAELAAEITSSAVTTYDKVVAIEEWMDTNIEYVESRRLPPLPDGSEAVEQFLFVDRAGFCEQIGTSAAVMLRTLGIPTRLATGFAPGEADRSSGEFVVRARDAHAWVEVWFPRSGWLGFDPTSGVPVRPGTDGDPFAGFSVPYAGQWWVLAVIAAVGGAAVVGTGMRRRVALTPGIASRPAAVLRSLDGEGRRRGVPRGRGEPITTYVDRLRERAGAGMELVTVGEASNQVFYAGRDPDTIDWDTVEDYFDAALNNESVSADRPGRDDA